MAMPLNTTIGIKLSAVAVMGRSTMESELYVVAPIVAEEMIEIQWIIGIIVVHHSHGVPFHLPFVEKSDAFQNLLE